MSTLLIEGGHKLEGRVAVEGNKNAALPLLAACLLTSETCELRNVPPIRDVQTTAPVFASTAWATPASVTMKSRPPAIASDGLLGTPRFIVQAT